MTSSPTTLENPFPSAPRETTFLRRVLFVDAATSAAAGLSLLAGAGPLESLLGLSAALLRPAGAILIAFSAFVAFVGSRPRISPAVVWAVIAANGLWAADSVALLLGNAVSPTGLGMAFVIAQAAAVAVLAELEWIGLRRA